MSTFSSPFLLKVSTLALMAALLVPMPALASQQINEEGKSYRSSLVLHLPERIQEKEHLSRLILEAVQGEPNHAERAQRCLRNFLEDSTFPSALIASKPSLMSLCQRLLQPEALLWQDKKAFNNLLTSPVLSADHPAVGPFVKTLADLKAISQTLSVSLPSALQKILMDVQAHYETYLNHLLLAPAADRPALMHPKALISGEGLFEAHPDGIHSYRLSQEMALSLLSKDHYGLFLKGNKQGSHAVCHKGKVYFKGNTTNTGLRVGLESASYALSQVLFGQGMAPSALLTLHEVEIKTPPEHSPARGDFGKALAEAKTSAEFFQHYPHHQEEFTEVTPHHLLQASQEVIGLSLESFLEQGLSFDCLDRDAFSEHILLSLLLNPSDGTPGNFMVQQELGQPDRLVGIDNDMAFGPSIVQTKTKKGIKHSIEVKNVLYCLPLMEEPFSASVRQRLLSLSPEQIILEWLRHLHSQEQKYQELTTISYQTDKKSTPYLSEAFYQQELHLPLKFAPEFIPHMIARLRQVQQRLKDRPVSTHRQLFHLMDPLAARFYQKIQADSESVLTAFHKISNSNQQDLFLEEVLAAQLDESLPSGQTVAQALEAETSPADVTRAWTQTVPKMIKDLFAQIDLSQHQRIVPFLEAALPVMQDKSSLHPSWRQEGVLLRALSEQISLESVRFLLDLGSDLRFRHPKTQQTVFHAAAQGQASRAVFEQLCQSLSKEERQALLNNKDSSNRTPLDEALLHKSPATFITLMERGAKECSATLALKFYQHFLRSAPTPEVEEAFRQLMTGNPEVEWIIALEELLPPLKGKKDPSEMTLHLSSYGERRLPKTIRDQLLDAQGNFISFARQGNHLVGCAQGRGALKQHHLYFKVYPALSGLEEASGSLTRQLLGFGAPHTDLAKVGSKPVLISQGVPGPTLLKVLQESPDLLRDLVEEDISGLMIAAMLINPEDGKPDNYIVTPHPAQPGKYRLVGIDNDQAFVPAIVKEKPDKQRLTGKPLPIAQVKTILYCLDQMKQPIAPAVRTRLINLSPDLFLQQWLRALKRINQSHSALFTEKEQAQAFKGQESFIGVPFQKGAIEHLYEKFVDLRDLLTAFPTLSHIDLLAKLEPRLAKRYQAALVKSLTPWQRFQEVDRPFYEVKKDGSHTTMTKSGMILQSAGIPLQEKLLDAIRTGHENSPVQALQELEQIIQQKSQQALEGLAARVGDVKLLQTFSVEESRSVFLKQLILQNKRLSPLEQAAVLSYLAQQKRVRDLLIPHFTVLADRHFSNLLGLEYLRQVDMRFCTGITNTTLVALSTHAPLLETLNLGHLSQLKLIGQLGLFKETPLLFKFLHTLNLAGCSQVTKLLIQAPQLTWLDVSGCLNLTDEGLDELIVHSPLLKILNLKGAEAITTYDLRQEFPTYPMSLLKGLTQPEAILNVLRSQNSTLGRTKIDPSSQGIQALTRALAQNTTLTDLNLENNKVGDAGAQALRANTKLKDLNL